MGLAVFSYGGGVQSTAALVLAARHEIDFPTFLFANVGDDSEHPATIDYVREVAQPYGAARGVEVLELHRTPAKGLAAGDCAGGGVLADPGDVLTDGSAICPSCTARLVPDGAGPAHRRVETLMGRLMRPGSRSLPIPVRMGDTGAPGTRSCTADFKIRVVGRWLTDHGASRDDPATVGVGISTDEWQRASSRREEAHERVVYPLLQVGLSRADCEGVIRDAGLPVPRKSACFFCPFHRPHVWGDMARDEPDLFEKACDLEDTLNRRRADLGKDSVYLTRFGRPLRRVIADAGTQLPLALYEQDEGYRCGDVCDT